MESLLALGPLPWKMSCYMVGERAAIPHPPTPARPTYTLPHHYHAPAWLYDNATQATDTYITLAGIRNKPRYTQSWWFMVNICRGGVATHQTPPIHWSQWMRKIQKGKVMGAFSWRTCVWVVGDGDIEAVGAFLPRCGKWDEREGKQKVWCGVQDSRSLYSLVPSMVSGTFLVASLVSVFSIFIALLIKHQYQWAFFVKSYRLLGAAVLGFSLIFGWLREVQVSATQSARRDWEWADWGGSRKGRQRMVFECCIVGVKDHQQKVMFSALIVGHCSADCGWVFLCVCVCAFLDAG